MKVAITGGTGTIGSALARALRERGDEVYVVSRSPGGSHVITWDPKVTGSLQLPEGTDAVVHLAGAPLFNQRWSEEYKQEIRDSRVQGTRTVVRALRDSDPPVPTFVSGSAVGYYGDRGDDRLTEESPPGEDFLAEVCQEWEEVALEFGEDAPTDVSVVRTGIVLSTEGGALPQMLNPVPFVKPFHWGMGGPLGSGSQFMPWIHIRDEVDVLMHLLDHSREGPFNLTAPNPVRNKQFTRTLGSVLNRPTPFPVPKFGLRILYGEAAEVLFASQRVIPERLQQDGFEFTFPRIEPALRDLLGSGA